MSNKDDTPPELDAWYRSSARADAVSEHWNIFDCGDSVYGRWQLCKYDNSDLIDDNEAWRIVLTGGKPHHARALALIKQFAPEEWERIMRAAPQLMEAIPPELVAEVTAAVLSS